MPNQINSSSSLWKQTQADIFADGKNDQSSANAGAIVTASLAEGQATTTAGVDGDLGQIDTGAEALALDPTENTSGNAAKAFSSTFLLRWAVKILQGISGKLPALVSGKIPVDAGGATAAEIGTAVNSALKGSSQPISAIALPLPPNAATESTLNSVLTQLQGDRAISSNLFIDSTNTIYLRVLAYNQQTNAFESSAIGLNGMAYTPTAPETPIQQNDYDTTEAVWEIVTNGTGYTIGDIISQFTLITQGPPIAVAGVLWINQSSQLAISAPLAGHRRRIGALAATESTVSAILSALGGVIDVDGSGATQPISAIALPLPSGAATESTLATIRDRARVSAVFTGAVQTSATGADFVALPSNPATSVILYNRSGTEISWRYGSSGQELRIADGIGEEISVVGNSNTIQIRRTDQSNTQVTINFRGELR